jgi:hypothetical protein
MTLMKSRRCIAFPKPKDRVNVALQHSRSNQEIATGGIGIIDHFAQQQSKPRMSLVGSRAAVLRTRADRPQQFQ